MVIQFVPMFRDSILEEIVSYSYKMAEVIPLFSRETISNQIKAITNSIWVWTV
jgi:hypothetical protein